jgi:hypothetical protein
MASTVAFALLTASLLAISFSSSSGTVVSYTTHATVYKSGASGGAAASGKSGSAGSKFDHGKATPVPVLENKSSGTSGSAGGVVKAHSDSKSTQSRAASDSSKSGATVTPPKSSGGATGGNAEAGVSSKSKVASKSSKGPVPKADAHKSSAAGSGGSGSW